MAQRTLFESTTFQENSAISGIKGLSGKGRVYCKMTVTKTKLTLMTGRD